MPPTTMRFLSPLQPAASSTWTIAAIAKGNQPSGSNRHLNVFLSSSVPSYSPQIHSSFAEIADRYDAFILDQFGVLHNGVEALQGAVEAVESLHKKRKKLIILSNTSAPSSNALSKLPKLGFNPDHFVGAITSGEEASNYVKRVYGSSEEKAKKVIFITWDTQIPNNPRLTAPPQAFLDKCGNVVVTDSIPDADFVVLHGSEVWYRGETAPQQFLGSFIDQGGLEVVDPLLHQFLQYKLPMICANPDLMVVTPTGGTAFMPGRIAKRYLELGGSCRSFGKPDVEHFEACLVALQMDSKDDRKRVAHVGDSLHHDIAGAVAANIPSVFVTSGIHASQLGTAFGEMPTLDVLDSLFENEGSILPTHVVSSFRI